jgi:hypothetical protein
MGFVMYLPGDLVLLLRVRNHFLALQHQLFRLISRGRDKAIVRGRASQTALLRSVSPVRVFPVLEVEPNLVEPLF